MLSTSFLLEGFQEQWSEWSAKSSVNFKNLPPGDYSFQVKAKFANAILDNTAIYFSRFLNLVSN
jgi:hypothetical protein